MHMYVFVLRILNRKNTYILHFDFFFNVSHICFTVFDLLLCIFFLDPFESTLHTSYPFPVSTTDVHPRNKHTEYSYQIQEFIITSVTVFHLQSLFQFHLFNCFLCFFSVTGSSPGSCYFIMTL